MNSALRLSHLLPALVLLGGSGSSAAEPSNTAVNDVSAADTAPGSAVGLGMSSTRGVNTTGSDAADGTAEGLTVGGTRENRFGAGVAATFSPPFFEQAMIGGSLKYHIRPTATLDAQLSVSKSYTALGAAVRYEPTLTRRGGFRLHGEVGGGPLVFGRSFRNFDVLAYALQVNVGLGVQLGRAPLEISLRGGPMLLWAGAVGIAPGAHLSAAVRYYFF